MYVGSKVKVNGEKRRDITTPIAEYVRQKPNKKFLGITKLKMRVFYAGSKNNSGRFKQYLRNKYGEPPVILDTAFIETSVKSMKSYLRNVGFYYPTVNYKVKSRRQRAKVIYHVETGKVYHIQSYDINCADKQVYDLIKATSNKAIIVPGNRLNHETILLEQKRVVDLMRNSGYFSFTNEFVGFDMDTALNNWQVRLMLNVANKSFYELHQPHYNKNVFVTIEPNYDVSNFKNKDTIAYKRWSYIPNRYKLHAQALDRNIYFNPNELFNQQMLSLTYTKLGDLGVFRFINITTKNYILNDTTRIDYYIKLAPNIKYDYNIEPQAIISDQNSNALSAQSNYGTYGVAAIAQFNNRNVFKNAELFKLTLRSSFEAQGKVNSGQWFNATQQSLTASLTIPRIIFFRKLDKNPKLSGTKTIFSASAIYELNTNFERRVLTVGGIYQLNKKYTSFYFTPLEISYTKNDIKSTALDTIINKDIYLYTMFSNNLIIGSRFGLTYTNKQKPNGLHYVYLRWDALEISGNIATFLNNVLGSERNQNGYYEIFDVNYSQFAKTALDFRFNTKYDKNNATVYRFYCGVGLPYGNSPKFLPFERRFWVGGANSLRAWLPRSLGPGSFYQDGQIDYSGDIKLEANAEYRFNLYNSWLEGAAFVDLGNVWMSKKDEIRPNANFELNRFWKEIAIGTGLGIRFNFEVILVRFDVAMPLHDPSYNTQSRWVIKSFNRDWLINNLNLNFGVGYPF